VAKKSERSQGSQKAKPPATRSNSREATREPLHPTHPVSVTLTADHDESDIVRGYPDFLNRLAQDDAFRLALLRNPDKVMADYGVKFDPPLSTAFTSGKIVLPPKNKVQELLDSLQKPAPSELIGWFNLMFEFWAVITTGGRK
jgi:hypothetical protein